MVLSRSDETDLLIPLYEGVQEVPPWERFLGRMQRRTRADYVALILRQGDTPMREATQFFVGTDMSARSRIVLPTDTRIIDSIAYEKLRPGRVYGDQDLADLGEPSLYGQRRDYLAAIGIGSIRVMRVTASNGLWAWLVITRETGGFVAADSALLSALAPNLAVALDIFAERESTRFHLAASQEAMARAGIGWSALDAKGGKISINQPLPVASRCLERNDDVASAACVYADFTGERPLLAAVMPAVIAYSREAPIGDERRAEALMQLYGLSRKEALLGVALANGQSLIDAARTVGLTIETARNYSKRIFAKTDTHGQADLVRLILTGPASLS